MYTPPCLFSLLCSYADPVYFCPIARPNAELLCASRAPSSCRSVGDLECLSGNLASSHALGVSGPLASPCPCKHCGPAHCSMLRPMCVVSLAALAHGNPIDTCVTVSTVLVVRVCVQSLCRVCLSLSRVSSRVCRCRARTRTIV